MNIYNVKPVYYTKPGIEKAVFFLASARVNEYTMYFTIIYRILKKCPHVTARIFMKIVFHKFVRGR